MDSAIRIGSSSMAIPVCSLPKLNPRARMGFGFRLTGSGFATKICAIAPNDSAPSPSSSSSHHGQLFWVFHGVSRSVGDMHRRLSSLESLFCYEKPIPEEIIEKPVGTAIAEKVIGNNPKCIDCEAKGAVLCTTCSGSGLYVDSILESQGIIVKVRCLGCGGTGNIMCSECGGRGHLGPN